MFKLMRCMTMLKIRDANPWSKSRWPRLIWSLSNLRTLSVDRHFCKLAESPLLLHQELLQLPSTITDLKVSAEQAPAAFLHYRPSGSVVKTTYERGSSELGDWSKVMPFLTSLEIADFVNCTSIEFADFAGFPSTLTKLHLPFFPRARSYSMQGLPHSITDLDLGLQLSVWTPAEPQYCLPEMTSLSIVRVVPEGWTSAGTTWTAALPHHLTSLTVLGAPFSAAEFASLPRTLTHLMGCTEFDGLLAEDFELSTLLPPKLSTLHAYMSNWLVENLNNASRAITELKLYGRPEELTPFDPSWIPRSVTHLSLCDMAREGMLEIGKGLPESLAKLTIRPDDNVEQGFDLEKSLPHLPPSITELDIRVANEFTGIDVFESDDLQWPPNLQTLNIDAFKSSWLKQLPDSLTVLKVTNDLEIDVNDDEDEDRAGDELSNVFEHLPPNLRILDVESEVEGPLRSESPRLTQLAHLEHLQLPFGLSFDPSFLASLPRTLRSLGIRIGEGLTQAHIATLPPRLRKASIYVPKSIKLESNDYLHLTIISVNDPNDPGRFVM